MKIFPLEKTRYTVVTRLRKLNFEVLQSFLTKILPYYARIMLNSFIHLLCLKLCWHNRLVPNNVSLDRVLQASVWCKI